MERMSFFWFNLQMGSFAKHFNSYKIFMNNLANFIKAVSPLKIYLFSSNKTYHIQFLIVFYFLGAVGRGNIHQLAVSN